MNNWFFVIFLLLSLVAEVLGTIGGFGSSVFFVPIGNYFLDIRSVLGITALFHLCSNASKIALFRKGIDKKILIHIGIPSVILVAAGAVLSKFIDKTFLELGLSILLIFLGLFFLIAKKIVLKPTKVNSWIGGSISGFLAGFLGTGGAVRGITLAAYNLEKEIFVATSALIDLGVDAVRTVIYIINGYVHTHDLYMIPFLLGVGFLGTYLGKLILKKIPQDKFRTIVLVLILVVGILSLLKYFNSLYHFLPNTITL